MFNISIFFLFRKRLTKTNFPVPMRDASLVRSWMNEGREVQLNSNSCGLVGKIKEVFKVTFTLGLLPWEKWQSIREFWALINILKGWLLLYYREQMDYWRYWQNWRSKHPYSRMTWVLTEMTWNDWVLNLFINVKKPEMANLPPEH